MMYYPLHDKKWPKKEKYIYSIKITYNEWASEGNQTTRQNEKPSSTYHHANIKLPVQ